jgi:hypothetical protein
MAEPSQDGCLVKLVPWKDLAGAPELLNANGRHPHMRIRRQSYALD